MPLRPPCRGALRQRYPHFPPLRGARRELTGIPGSPPDVSNLPPGCPFEPRCAFAFDRCKVDRPELGPTAFDERGRSVACLRHERGEMLPPELAVRTDARDDVWRPPALEADSLDRA